jgi:hypothetical protein
MKVFDAEHDLMMASLERFAAFGSKASGGPGDNAAGEWLGGELESCGYIIERQPFSVPFFDPSVTLLQAAGKEVVVQPQAIVVPTPAEGVSGRLVRVDAATATSAAKSGRVRDAIALVDLPFARWSTAKPIIPVIEALFAAGANAAILVTNGPSGKAVALNTASETPVFARPTAILAPERAAPYYVAAQDGARATLRILGKGGVRSAFNVIGRANRGRGRWLVVSTPRSGWFDCAGERGPGVAIWLGLARWAMTNAPDHDLAFICTSGHEYENFGGKLALATAAPKPASSALWVHLGSNLATRDWHDLMPTLTPLTTADPQRYFVTSPQYVEHAARAFEGQSGLCDPYSDPAVADGELKEIMAAGYSTVSGAFGAHRFHHVREDDERCFLPSATFAAQRGFTNFIAAALGDDY